MTSPPESSRTAITVEQPEKPLPNKGASEGNDSANFPLTLAEVLYAELYGDPNQAPGLKEDSADQTDVSKEKSKEKEEEARRDQTRKKIKADLDEILRKETNWEERKNKSDSIVPSIYQAIHCLPPEPKEPRETKKSPGPWGPRSALCLSGGGVRSATFNLGVLQGLARCKLLDKFDYLSTVSGGGFIGSWLTAWIKRKGLEEVIRELAKPPVTHPIKPEPDPVYNLRVYSNYLTPRKGFFSPDTWALIAVYLRNLFLNWCVFIPAIMALLMLPRIWVAFVKSPYLGPNASLIIAFILGTAALSYVSLSLPNSRALNCREAWFVGCCMLPLLVSAMALTNYWAQLRGDDIPGWLPFVEFGAGLAVVPVLFLIGAHIIGPRFRAWRAQRRGGNAHASAQAPSSLERNGKRALGNVGALVLIFIAFIGSALLTWYIVNIDRFRPPLGLVSGHARLYAMLAVPALLLMLSGGGTLIAGFTSRFTQVYDQEWWARGGGWILLVAAGWSAFHFLVLFCPSLFLYLQALVLQRQWKWASIYGMVTTVIGIGSGAISVLGGFSSKTSAQGPDGKPSKSRLLSLSVPIAAAIFGVFIVICLSLITDWILALGSDKLVLHNPRGVIYQTPLGVLLAIGVGMAVLSGFLGLWINTNKFSLHYYWRNRMMRAYLGVSRTRDDRETTRNKFTDLDLFDNLRMWLLDRRPFHVVNVTLNLTGGDKLEWQDRKAESFTMSPLHCGSYWLGYRSSDVYGGKTGMSLATAAAISGAAASPNMGYMMTSSIVRFIMTLFNVRLGFWLGNPGPKGAKRNRPPTYNLDSPRESVRPIAAEALGLTNDRNPYVYLSDGGHFENLGLYEMILRRCRFIVVSDASTDTDYDFESLVMAIRQIRVDFGVPIDMGEMKFDKRPDARNNYCALGVIRYSCVDKPGGNHHGETDPKYDGVLVYLKPSLIGDEPRDVLNYHRSSPTFPEETIADQWFSESQFESYRMLGSHMVARICKDGAASVDSAPVEVLLGGTKVSTATEGRREELDIAGWIERLTATRAAQTRTSVLEDQIEPVIIELKKSVPEFEKFASGARLHVQRHG